MIILKKVLLEIKSTVGACKPESGGMLGEKNGIICEFYFDNGNSTDSEYAPNVNVLNRVLEKWRNDGISFAGILHSHPNDQRLMSYNDEESARSISDSVALNKELYFPILTFNDGDIVITSYKINNDIIEADSLLIL